MSKKKKLLLIAGISVMVLIAGALSVWGFIVYCNRVIGDCGKLCYSEIEQLPARDVALLLGVAKITPSGKPNAYFKGRIEAAAALYHAGKIRHIIISGDNSRKDYNEPQDMKEALMEKGVPETAMTLDYAGFRTLDSVVRAKTVFGKEKLLIITQNGHAERAVYIARKNGIDAAAFYAPEPIQYQWLVKRNRKREILARIAAWFDINILNRTPKFTK